MASLHTVAPAFVEMAHRLVWSVAATVDERGRPRTRVLHPIWEWAGERLTGWVATSPLSPKRRHLADHPYMSFTYWAPSQDTCTADVEVAWLEDPDDLEEVWNRFAAGPQPVGYEPSIIPGWDSPEAEAFGALRLDPYRLRVMPGSVLLAGEGDVLTWG